LASKVLALNMKRLPADWLATHGHTVLIAETFVDHSRFTGTCYRAAGWVPLGKTSGYGRKAGVYYYHGESKTIFVKPLHKDAHKILSASFLPPEYEGGEKGTKSFIGIGEWAANLSQEMLKRLGCKYSDNRLFGNQFVLGKGNWLSVGIDPWSLVH